MKIKLPVVFRVNPNYPNYKVFCNKIQSETSRGQVCEVFLADVMLFNTITPTGLSYTHVSVCMYGGELKS